MTGKQSQFEADNPINLGIRRQDNDNARTCRVGIGHFLVRAAVAGTIAISALVEIPGLIGGDLTAYAQTASQSGPEWKDLGYLSAADWETARKAGFESAELFNRIYDTSTVDSYCEWADASYAVTEQAIDKFGWPETAKAIQEKTDWEETRQVRLKDQLLADLKLSDSEFSMLHLVARRWDKYCEVTRSGGVYLLRGQ